jgi:hypothetical protein
MVIMFMDDVMSAHKSDHNVTGVTTPQQYTSLGNVPLGAFSRRSYSVALLLLDAALSLSLDSIL